MAGSSAGAVPGGEGGTDGVEGGGGDEEGVGGFADAGDGNGVAAAGGGADGFGKRLPQFWQTKRPSSRCANQARGEGEQAWQVLKAMRTLPSPSRMARSWTSGASSFGTFT